MKGSAIRIQRDVMYCEGPGDVVSAFKAWQQQLDPTGETSITFSSQVFDYCKARNLSLLAVSYCSTPGFADDGDIAALNLPRRRFAIPRIGYHLGLLVYAFRLTRLAVRTRPKIIFINSGVVGWAAAILLRISGARIVPILHNTLWPALRAPTTLKASLRFAGTRIFWRYFADETLAVSEEVLRQVRRVVPGPRKAMHVFQPSFPAQEFRHPPEPANFGERPFRVLFAGRLEADKGILDLVLIAERLRELDAGGFEFVICGDGSAGNALREAIASRQLADFMLVRGRLKRPELLAAYARAHVVIVPTRTSFTEGYAMVVAEALLMLKPVVTNRGVPSTETLGGAVLFAEADDVESYAQKLLQISRDGSLYSRLVDAARALRPTILDQSNSLRAKMDEISLP
jgi:glycosyltransferase involved in cell wall biosynthesis